MVNGQEYVNLLEPELRSLASWESGTVYPSPSDPNRLVFHDGYWTAATVAKQTVAEISGVPSAVRALVASVADRARTPREDGAKILVGKGVDPDAAVLWVEHEIWMAMPQEAQDEVINNRSWKPVFVSAPEQPPLAGKVVALEVEPTGETVEGEPEYNVKFPPKIIDPAADPPPPCHPPQPGGIVMQECPSEEPTIGDAVEPQTIGEPPEPVDPPPMKAQEIELADDPDAPIHIPDPPPPPTAAQDATDVLNRIDEAIDICGSDPARALAKQYLQEAKNVYPKA